MDTLFSAPRRRRGPTEAAAEKTLRAWRAAGAEIDPLLASMMRGAAADVDTAERDHANADAGLFPATRARALLLETYRQAVPETTAGTDAVDDALVSLLAAADAAPA